MACGMTISITRRASRLPDVATATSTIIVDTRRNLFQGQYYSWQKQLRGSPITTQPAHSLITFLQNHDQVANTFYGQRLADITSPGRLRTMTALLLLLPQTPMLFMGQEFGSRTLFT